MVVDLDLWVGRWWRMVNSSRETAEMGVRQRGHWAVLWVVVVGVAVEELTVEVAWWSFFIRSFFSSWVRRSEAMESMEEREDAEWERVRGGESGWENTVGAWWVVVADEVVESGGNLNFGLLAVADLGDDMSSGDLKKGSWSLILDRVLRRAGRSCSEGTLKLVILLPVGPGDLSSSGA